MIYLLLLTHFISDFLLQTREMAENKSSNWKYLLQHIGIISICFLIITQGNIEFVIINSLAHLIIDKFLWNFYKEFYIYRANKTNKHIDYWKDSWFYTTIGFDQLLHVMTLIYCYNKFIVGYL